MAEFDDFFGVDRQQAAASAVFALNENPDDAARAKELGETSGVDSALIYPNVVQFEGQQKARVVNGLFNQNRFLREYVNSDPLAAKVSNDDWGQLDKITELAGKLPTPIGGLSVKDTSSLLSTAMHGFAEGFGPGGLGASWIKAEDIEKHPLAAATYSVLGSPIEGMLRFGSGAITALARLGEAGAAKLGLDPDVAKQHADNFIQASGDPGLWATLGGLGETLGQPFIMAAHNAALREAARIESWAREGKVPPPGVSPITDALHVEQAKIDAENLQEALKESVKSTTRERSPDLYSKFVEQVVGDQQIGVSADAVKALYGDKVPAPDDGILGWVPRIQEQLQTAEATGGDVKIPLADWLAKVEPEIAKQLNDHVRVRPEGLTVEEAKTPIEAYHGSPYPFEQLDPNKAPFYFTKHPDIASEYAVTTYEEGWAALQGKKIETPGKAPHVMPVRLRMDKPFEADIRDMEATGNARNPEWLKEHGYDSAILHYPPDERLSEYIIPTVEQVIPRYIPVETVRDTAALRPLEPTPESTTKAKQLSLDLPDTTPLDQREAFEKAAAIGMTVDQYNRYQKLIEKRAKADADAASARVLEATRRRQTTEWKDNRREVRKEVVEDFANAPEYELHQMLADGTTKLRADSLTDAQKALFPKDWVAREGIHPDDLQTLFGDPTILSRVEVLEQNRRNANMNSIEFRRRMIEAETDKRMEAKYGDLGKNIIDEAKDQVLTHTQEDLLHEEVMALASQAGAEYSIKAADLRGWVQERFNNLPVRDVASDRFLADAGRAGRNAEMALLKGDPAEAFRQKQRQYLSVVMANEARKFEKTQAKFEGFAKRFSAREIASVLQEYTDRIHEIMSKLGLKVKRSSEDLEAAIARDGQSLAEFVDYKERHDLREVPVAEYLLDPGFRNRVEDLTTTQFNQLYSSLKALEENGRDEKSVYRAGEKADFEAVRDQMLDSLQRFEKAERDIKGRKVEIAGAPRRLLRSFIASHLQIETILNRLDRWDVKGPWTQYLFRPLAEAANHEAKLERKYSAAMKAIADNANLKDVIPNSPFQVPRSDTTATMTRKNLRAVMLNLGNESNFNKLAAGYLHAEDGVPPGGNRLGVFKDQIKNWVDRHATKEDWDWVQKIWDMFAEIKKESDIMYQNVAGIEPESLRIRPVQTPHGEYKGGYYPLIRNEFYGENLKFDKADLEGQGYIRATTSAGYTKQRTGAIYPLELDLDALPGRVKQVIHDIAYRPAVIQAGKFVYDKKLMAEVKDRLGPEVANLFQPWLKDIANQQNFMVSKDMKEMSYWTNFIRQNVTTTLVGLNPSTFMKHTPTALVSSMAEVGPGKFLNELRALTSINEHFGESNWQFAMKTSEELQRRHRNWLETLTGGVAELEGKTTAKALRQGEYGEAFMSFRNTVSNLSSKPVALGDLMSAVPTWLAKYKAEMEAHGVHGDAMYAADKAVRQAHGSTAMPSRSAVSRSPYLSWFTGFFTFFNDLLNRQIETVWKAGEIKGLVEEGQHAEAMRVARNVTARLTAYVLMPALIEELVTPLASDQNESWGKKAAKGLTFTLGASWVGVRDVVNAMLNARDPSAGLVSTLYKSAPDLVRDINAKQGVKPENIIKHGAQLSGFLTGIPPAQVGRIGAGIERYMAGQEKPKGPWGWLVLGRYGTTQKHSQTLEDWIKHH